VTYLAKNLLDWGVGVEIEQIEQLLRRRVSTRRA
jgi:hypothetical protein